MSHNAAILMAGDGIVVGYQTSPKRIQRHTLDRVLVIQFKDDESIREAIQTGRAEFSFGWPKDEKPKPRSTPSLPGMAEA